MEQGEGFGVPPRPALTDGTKRGVKKESRMTRYGSLANLLASYAKALDW
jgi:hypothetical protein